MTGSDQPTIHNAAHPTPPPAPRSGRGPWIGLSIAAAVLLIGGGALLTIVLLGSGSDSDVTAADNATGASELEGRPVDEDDTAATDPGADPSSAGSPTTDPAPTLAPPTSPAPTTAAPTTAPPPTSPPAVTATVRRTCGSSGTGDCYVSLRAGPSSNGAELRRLNEGATVSVECQQRGQAAESTVLGYSTDVWARSTDGAWMSMAFLDAPGWSLTDVTVPC